VRLRYRCSRPDHFSAFATPIARCQRRASNRRNAGGKSSPWGKARWRAASRVPSISKTIQVFPARVH
jgi:hypothetical protein